MKQLKIIPLSLLFLVAITLFLVGCKKAAPITESVSIDSASLVPKRDTITALNTKLKAGEYIFKTKKGNFFVMNVESLQDTLEQYATKSATESFREEDLAASDNQTCNTDEFEGTDRAGVKTTKSRAQLETNVDAKALFEELSAGEDNLCANRQQFTANRRESIENRNVQLNKVYLYTFKRQKDEDYHLIVGTSKNPRTAYFFNVEISGNPPAGAYGRQDIIQARNDFEEYFELTYCADSYYEQNFRNDPIPVIITGSIFYDAWHCSSFASSGPQRWTEIKLQTAWEIHPITKIEFLE